MLYSYLKKLLVFVLADHTPARVDFAGVNPWLEKGAKLWEVVAGIKVDVKVCSQEDVDQEHQVETPPDLKHHMDTCIVYVIIAVFSAHPIFHNFFYWFPYENYLVSIYFRSISSF